MRVKAYIDIRIDIRLRDRYGMVQIESDTFILIISPVLLEL